jgi:hypothetical protein
MGLDGLVELGRYGQLNVRSRHYLGAVVDGFGHQEVVGYTRLSYDVDVMDHFGVGFAPTLVHRRSSSGSGRVTDTPLDIQVYLRVHD